MARATCCVSGLLSLTVVLLASGSDATAGPAGGGFARGHAAGRTPGQAAVWRTREGFRAHGLDRGRFGHVRGKRFRHHPSVVVAGWSGGTGFFDFGRDALAFNGGSAYPVHMGAAFGHAPVVIGIRDAPVASPTIYVIKAPGASSGPKLQRKRAFHPGPKILTRSIGMPVQRAVAGRDLESSGPVGGARIIHVTAPRGS